MKIKDWIRNVNRFPVIERFLAKKCQDKSLDNFWVRLLPSIYSYPKKSLRRVQRNGINYELDISDYHGYKLYFGLDVEPGLKTLLSMVKNGMTIIDAGTNIGEVLLNISKLNPLGRNIGFEPVKQSYDMAIRNIELNHFTNVDVYNLALSDTVDEVFYEIPPNRNRGSVQMNKKHQSGREIAQSVSLDCFAKQNGLTQVDLIKIDTEGFEYNILLGARYLIDRFRPLLFIEINDTYLKRNNSSATQLLNYLFDVGYKLTDAETFLPVEKSTCMDKPFDIVCTPAA